MQVNFAYILHFLRNVFRIILLSVNMIYIYPEENVTYIFLHFLKTYERMIQLTTDNISPNKEAILVGTVEGELGFSHEIYGETFYSFVLKVMRLSDICDYINITVSERLIQNMQLSPGSTVSVVGQFRSYNNYCETGNRLILTVFARDIREESDAYDPLFEKNPNSIFLDGFLCKAPVYRTTPFGREITDLLIAVNRAYNKSDYIPCIAWGRNARYSSGLSVGDNIKVWGRIQSREYQKKISEDECVTKTAYEISISKMEVISSAINSEDAEII